MNTEHRISVVVPYFNEVGTLTYVLESLNHQTVQPSEVILVNSSSTDGSFQLVNEWIRTHKAESRFKNLNAHTTTPGGSKSAGIRESHGDLIAFMDCGLDFPHDWLERQLRLLQTSEADWVSGVCHTEGANLIDKAAIAHTYGYRQSRAVIPSSVIRRSVFDVVGEFRDLRAGYDAEWARKAVQMNMRREINSDVVVRYQDINFASNLAGVFSKSVRYARPSVARDDTRTPQIYVVAAVVGVVISIFSLMTTAIVIAGYLVARTALAWRRGNDVAYFFFTPVRFITLNIVAMVMDFGKLVGFISGLYIRYVLRRAFTH